MPETKYLYTVVCKVKETQITLPHFLQCWLDSSSLIFKTKNWPSLVSTTYFKGIFNRGNTFLSLSFSRSPSETHLMVSEWVNRGHALDQPPNACLTLSALQTVSLLQEPTCPLHFVFPPSVCVCVFMCVWESDAGFRALLRLVYSHRTNKSLMCFSNPDSCGWHHVNNWMKNISSSPPFFFFSLPSPVLPSLSLSFINIFHFQRFFCLHSNRPVPPSTLSFSVHADYDPPFPFFFWGDTESCNHREVVFEGSDWAQLYTTV